MAPLVVALLAVGGVTATSAEATSADVTAFSWGLSSSGQRGTGSSSSTSVPGEVLSTGVLAGKSLTAISAGESHACALDSDGLAYCWGYGADGRLGNNSTANSSVPVAVDASGVLAGKTLTAISAGKDHTCALDGGGLAYCWGLGTYGRLGNNSTASSSVPVAVDASGVLVGKTLTAISAGGNFTCALASDGTSYCWGHGGIGQLGTGSTSDSSVPVAVSTSGALAGQSLTSISAGLLHACAVAAGGRGYCWGNDGSGQLGDGATAGPQTSPVQVDSSGVLSGKSLTSVSASEYSTCAASSDGRGYCWGYNVYGQLGDGTTTTSNVPVAVVNTGALSGQVITSISMGGQNSCAVVADGSAYCWGYNYSGQLGDGSTTNSLVPVAVDMAGLPTGQGFVAISVGLAFAVSLVGVPGSSSVAGVTSSSPVYQFVFLLPDGRECTAIGPVVVRGGTRYALPGSDADCVTPGSTVAGWRIPGQAWAFVPGQVVAVSDSQQFTAVLREPTVRIILDANVASGDSCVSPRSSEVDPREVTLYLDRPDMSARDRGVRPAVDSFPAPSEAPCTPSGHRLVGWNTAGDGSGLSVAPGGVFEPALDEAANEIRLFAMWQAQPA